MKINWFVIFLLAIAVVFLLVFVIRRNQKEKKKLEKFLDHDFSKDKKSELNDED